MRKVLACASWTPPLAVPAVMLAICAAFSLNLDSTLPWVISGKTWRLGNVIDITTLIATMWEMARAARIDSSGLIAAVVGMIVPRALVGVIVFLVPVMLADPHVANLLTATLGAPGLAGLVRVAVARRDIALSK